MSFLATDKTTLTIFSSKGLSFEEFDFLLLLPFPIHEKSFLLSGGWLVSAAAVFFSALDLQIILFAGLRVFFPVFENVLKEDLLTAQLV